MALSEVASDDFNRGDGGLGANWTDTIDEDLDPTISSNQVISSGDGDAAAFWNADAFENNQYSQVTIVNIGTDYSGVLVRADDSDYVFGQIKGSNVAIGWYDGGDYTNIALEAYQVQNGDIMRLEAEGTTYRLYINNVLKASGTNASAPGTGSAGILISTTGAIIDDWSGGNITAGTVVQDPIGPGIVAFPR